MSVISLTDHILKSSIPCTPVRGSVQLQHNLQKLDAFLAEAYELQRHNRPATTFALYAPGRQGYRKFGGTHLAQPAFIPYSPEPLNSFSHLLLKPHVPRLPPMLMVMLAPRINPVAVFETEIAKESPEKTHGSLKDPNSVQTNRSLISIPLIIEPQKSRDI
ncbi:hypothetical protein EVAR_78083_1 [Eumeta japonica]|uniref:Uncharacterized protein n=1 Tax=Eumeta variegata TaxID=151549 RepID=A0A4C1T0F3_EUMVA|nr:hypothetical protein EVAR_78083_1 [Eumeta japonica]